MDMDVDNENDNNNHQNNIHTYSRISSKNLNLSHSGHSPSPSPSPSSSPPPSSDPNNDNDNEVHVTMEDDEDISPSLSTHSIRKNKRRNSSSPSPSNSNGKPKKGRETRTSATSSSSQTNYSSHYSSSLSPSLSLPSTSLPVPSFYILQQSLQCLQSDDVNTFRSLFDDRQNHLRVNDIILQNSDLDVVDDTSILHLASRNNAVKCISFLLDKRVNINILDERMSTALDEAAQYGSIEAAKLLLTRGIKWNLLGNVNSNMFHTAASEGEWKFIKEILLSHGNQKLKKVKMSSKRNNNNNHNDNEHKDSHPSSEDQSESESSDSDTDNEEDSLTISSLINDKNKEGMTPLAYACKSPSHSFMTSKVLISHGSSTNTKDKFDNSLLHQCCKRGNFECLKYLLTQHSMTKFLEAENKEGKKPFDIYQWDGRESEVNKDGEYVDKEGKVISAMDLEEFDEEEFKEKVLWNHQDVINDHENAQNNKKNHRSSSSSSSSPLSSSCPSSRPRIQSSDSLLQNHFESKYSRCKRYFWQYFLLMAVMKGDDGDAKEVEKLLTERKKDVECGKYRLFPLNFSGFSHSPQQISVSYENDSTQILKLLLSNGMKFDSPANEATTYLPIHEASNVGNSKAVEMLIANGEDPNAKEKGDRYSPLTLAADHTNGKEVTSVLLKGGADIFHQDLHGNSALHWAVFRCNLKMAQEILSHVKQMIPTPSMENPLETLLNKQNQWGNSAMHYACYKAFKNPRRLFCLKLLLENEGNTQYPTNKQGQAPKDVVAGFLTDHGKIAKSVCKEGMSKKEAVEIIDKYLSELRYDHNKDQEDGKENKDNNEDNEAEKEKDKEKEKGKRGGRKQPSVSPSPVPSDDVDPIHSSPSPPSQTAKKKSNYFDSLESYRKSEQKKVDDLLSLPILFSLKDISHQQEAIPIPLINTLDTTSLDLQYISHVIPHKNVPWSAMRNSDKRCVCTDDCRDGKTCACIAKFPLPKEKEERKDNHSSLSSSSLSPSPSLSPPPAETSLRSSSFIPGSLAHSIFERRRHLPSFHRQSHLGLHCHSIEMLQECSDLCGCPLSCSNRITDRGIGVPMQVYKTREKGWAARAMDDIPLGTYVSEYVGEMIDESEAQKRMKEYDIKGIHYIFGLRNSPYVLDPYKKGNVGRLFNHSCDPNLTKIQIYRAFTEMETEGRGMTEHETAILHTPRMVFVAARDIAKGEELCISYDYEELEYPGGCLVCFCGANNCRQNLV